MSLNCSVEVSHELNLPHLQRMLLDRLTHHVHILEMNGESFRLATSKKAQRRTGQASTATQKTAGEGDADTKI